MIKKLRQLYYKNSPKFIEVLPYFIDTDDPKADHYYKLNIYGDRDGLKLIRSEAPLLIEHLGQFEDILKYFEIDKLHNIKGHELPYFEI